MIQIVGNQQAFPVTPSDTANLKDSQRTLVNDGVIASDHYDEMTNVITFVDSEYSNFDELEVIDPGSTDLTVGQIVYAINVSGADIQLAESDLSEDVIVLGGDHADSPSFKRLSTITQNGVIGMVFNGNTTSKTFVVLPQGHIDTDNATPQPRGAVQFVVPPGLAVPVACKKVFETGTDATVITCVYT